MLRTLAAITMLAATMLVASSAAAPHHRTHRPGCNTKRCDHFADRAWGHRHHPRPRGRAAVASFYGGGSGACGGGSFGVANKTLPCHTWLTICAARCARMQVIDRGPYIAGREFDLTTEAAEAIGFSMSAGVATVRVIGG